ncbi:MAG: prolyl oligopeptidase family serine peptidase, partial [Acidobacteria bacterium]|nr:prolyl oligopeptidase family serine peptidase [Acidobacteriota bacterium]
RLPGDIYFLLKALPGESTAKLYIRQDLNGEDRLVVDPQRIKLNPEDQGKGTTVIEWFAVSNNQKKVAVLVIPGGDELHGELHVLDIESGRESGEVLTQVGAEAPQVYWLPDDRSFVYGRLQKLPPGAPAAEVRQKYRSYLHVLGNSPEQDQPIFGYGVVPGIDVDPSLIASVVIQHGSHWALGVLNGSTTPNSAYYIEPLSDLGKNHSWRKIADFADGVTDVQLRDDNLYLLTYKNAPRYKVLRTDARHPDLASAETVVPTGDSVVATINSAQDALYVQFQDGAITRVSRLPYGDGAKMRDLELPVAGSAFLNTDPLVPGALFAVSSWTSAVKIYAYNPATGQLADTHLQPSGPYDNPGHIESKEVKARSYDGTLVPLSIIYPKDLKLDGSNPTLLEGYGAYGVSYTPYFRPTRSAWYEQGGVYAVCHVRGGGEYGEEWHLAGKIAKKPNTWRDFIACAQYLIQQKYTSSARLAGEGGSAGGILIGRAITSNPEIFAAAIDVVGMSDALRSELTQNGETNIPEFGSVQTREGFNALYTMSPYHHVVDKTPYPAVLLETGINDPRVDPWQMAKMAARLQAATSSGKPILLRIDYAGGHSSLNATAEQIEEQRADEFSFLLWTFGIPGFRTTPDLVKPQ